MPLSWLPEDDTHPIRPDLPVVRHLTFTEAHAIELGIYVGLLAYFAVQFGLAGEAITLLIAITRFTISDGKARCGATKSTHRIGFHDVRLEPQYFGAGFLLAFAGFYAVAELWGFLAEAGVPM